MPEPATDVVTGLGDVALVEQGVGGAGSPHGAASASAWILSIPCNPALPTVSSSSVGTSNRARTVLANPLTVLANPFDPGFHQDCAERAMHLTSYTDYTLRVLMYLALNPERTATVAEIADAYGISRMHLNKVVHELGQAGDVETLRGRKGGIRLGKPADAINLADVVRRAEPETEIVPCFGNARSCILGRCCLLQGILQRADHAFFAELAQYTLADLVRSRDIMTKVFLPQQPPGGPARAAASPRRKSDAPA